MTISVNQIQVGQFDVLPARTRNGGGGGRRSEVMDYLRTELAEPGSYADVPVELQYRNRRNPETNKKEPLMDDAGNPVLETWEQAAQRIKMRFYGKTNGKYPLGFKPAIYDRPDSNCIRIYHPKSETQDNGEASV